MSGRRVLAPHMIGRRVLAPHMIGRRAQLQELEAHLQAARGGAGRVVCIVGEAGVGKTCLARSFTHSACRDAGTDVLLGHCHDEDTALPYGPFIDALRAFLRAHGPDAVVREAGPWAGDLTKLLPEIEPMAPACGADGDLQSQKRRLFDAIYRVMRPHGGQTCRVIVLEDLHWADATSQELVRYLARAIEHVPILILGAYRGDELHRHHPLTHLVAALTRERLYHEIPLAPLSRDECTQMLESTLERPLPDAFVHALHGHTDGNPFFLEEMLTALIERGQLDALIQDTRQGKPPPHLDLPRSLTESILSRAADLDASASAVLRVAAVVGRRFDFEVLPRLTGLEEAEVVRAIEALVARHLVVEDTDGPRDRYSFRHALTREAVYRDLLARDRRLKHQAVRQVLEEMYGANLELVVDQLAYHSLHAGERHKAAHYARLAARRAEHMHAYQEAVAQYEVALKLIDTDDPYARAQLYEALGEAAFPLADSDQYLRYWQEARRLYEQAGDRRAAADIRRRLGRVSWERGDDEAAFAHTRAAIAALEGEPPGRELALACSALSSLYMLSARPRESVAWGQRALRLADELGDDAARAHALNNIGGALGQQGDTAQGIAHLERSLEVATRAGLTFDAIRACLNLGDWLNLLGEARRAAKVSRDGLSLAEQGGWKSHRGQLLDNLATAEMELGHWDEARELLEQAVRAGEMGVPIARLFALRTTGELLWRQGRPDEAARLLEGILPACEAQGEFQSLGRLLPTLARAYLARGDAGRAAATLDRCVALRPDLALLVGTQDLLGDCVEIYLRVGRAHDARAHLENLSTLAGRAVSRLSHVRLADARGLMASHERRHGEAAGHFQQATSLWGEMAYPYQEARSRRHRAESLLHGHSATAREEAGHELAAAWETITALGALREIQDIEAVVKRQGLTARVVRAARATAAQPDTLTPREREVLILIARGCTNREIAAQLVISHKTVEIHVGNVLGKLGYTSRAQAAAYAVARGLVVVRDA